MLCHINFPQPTTATTTPSSSKATAAAARNNHQTEIKNNPQNKQTNKLAERDVCNDVYVITREIKEAKRNRLVYFVDHCIHPSIHLSRPSFYLAHLFWERRGKRKRRRRGGKRRDRDKWNKKKEKRIRRSCNDNEALWFTMQPYQLEAGWIHWILIYLYMRAVSVCVCYIYIYGVSTTSKCRPKSDRPTAM